MHDVVTALRRSLLQINDVGDLERLPYGSVIIAKVETYTGIHTLIKVGPQDWVNFTICGEPGREFYVEEEEGFVPRVPAVLVSCGETLPDTDDAPPPSVRHLRVVKNRP